MGLARILVKIRKNKKEREEKEIRHALLARNKINKKMDRQAALEQARKEKTDAKAREAKYKKEHPSFLTTLGKNLLSDAKEIGKNYAKNMAERDRAERRAARKTTAKSKKRKTKRG